MHYHPQAHKTKDASLGDVTFASGKLFVKVAEGYDGSYPPFSGKWAQICTNSTPMDQRPEMQTVETGFADLRASVEGLRAALLELSHMVVDQSVTIKELKKKIAEKEEHVILKEGGSTPQIGERPIEL